MLLRADLGTPANIKCEGAMMNECWLVDLRSDFVGAYRKIIICWPINNDFGALVDSEHRSSALWVYSEQAFSECEWLPGAWEQLKTSFVKGQSHHPVSISIRWLLLIGDCWWFWRPLFSPVGWFEEIFLCLVWRARFAQLRHGGLDYNHSLGGINYSNRSVMLLYLVSCCYY